MFAIESMRVLQKSNLKENQDGGRCNLKKIVKCDISATFQ